MFLIFSLFLNIFFIFQIFSLFFNIFFIFLIFSLFLKYFLRFFIIFFIFKNIFLIFLIPKADFGGFSPKCLLSLKVYLKSATFSSRQGRDPRPGRDGLRAAGRLGSGSGADALRDSVIYTAAATIFFTIFRVSGET